MRILILGMALCAGMLAMTSHHAKADPLKDYLWEQRVFVVFAPNANNLEARRQVNWLELQKGDFAERDMVLIKAYHNPNEVIVDDLNGTVRNDFPHSAAALFERYRADRGEFSAMLVGKDGGVKARYQHPTRAVDIFELIDTMPMRKRELEKAKEKNKARERY